MTQFRVLPVRLGDAYLLRSARGGYLVDGGGFGCGLPEMLRDRKVRKLRAVVCSTPRAEKLGGILELVESGFPVTECWLPDRVESLPEMARRFNGDVAGWQMAVGGELMESPELSWWPEWLSASPVTERGRRLHGAVALLALGLSVLPVERPFSGAALNWASAADVESYMGNVLAVLASRGAARWSGQRGSVRQALDGLGWGLFAGGGVEELSFLCGRLLLAEADVMIEEKCTANLIRGIALGVMTASLAARMDIRLRFFRRTDRVENQHISHHPLRCLNGIEVDPLEGLPSDVAPDMLAREAGRLAGGREGLVFQYGDARCCVMLCGEGKMKFLGRGEALFLDRPTVVAAPGRGSCASDRAYGHIESIAPMNDVWVRGFLPTGRKVSPYYKDQRKTMCLNSCETYAVQEIVLEFADDRWNRRSGGCCLNASS